MVVSTEEIKRVTLDYCVNNLENSSPDPEVEMESTIKQYLHSIRMENDDIEGFEISNETLNVFYKSLAQKAQKVMTSC